MGRYPEAPWDFDCPYKHRCPHMKGHSSTWALLRIKRASELNHDYWQLSDLFREHEDKYHQQIAELTAERDQLKAQLKALHQRQFKANRKVKSKAPTKERPASSKPRGAPTGHPYWHREPPEEIDQVINVDAPEVCPHCQCEHLQPCDDVHEHLQEDIVLQPKTQVVNFRHKQAYCPKCRRPVFKDGPSELRHSAIGPVAKATAVYLRYGLRMTYRNVQQLFDTLFNLSFVPASAMAFDRAATQKGLPLYEDLKVKIQQAQHVYADETHWRQNGQSGQVWYAGNNELAVFHIAMSRASAEAVELLGDDFGGSLVTDGYAAYLATNPKQHQTCLAHLIRKARDILHEGNL